MASDWPPGFKTLSISAALDALSDVGVSTKVTVPVCEDIRFDDAEVGSVFIDCTAEARFRRSYPSLYEAMSDASWLKRTLVEWLSWPWRPGVISAETGGTLTNAPRARIRVCRDADQYWKLRDALSVDSGVPTIYVLTESGLRNAVRVIGRELTIAPTRRRVRGFGETVGHALVSLLILLWVLGCCLFVGAGVIGFGRNLGFW